MTATTMQGMDVVLDVQLRPTLMEEPNPDSFVLQVTGWLLTTVMNGAEMAGDQIIQTLLTLDEICSD